MCVCVCADVDMKVVEKYALSSAWKFVYFFSHWELHFLIFSGSRLASILLCFSLQHGYHSNPTTPKLQHTSNQEQYDQCGNSTELSQVSDDGYINVRNIQFQVTSSWSFILQLSKINVYITRLVILSMRLVSMMLSLVYQRVLS